MTVKEKLKLMGDTERRNDERIKVYVMTNRELYEMYETATDNRRLVALAEMARRLHNAMVIDEVPRIFKQYKLNGAGDQCF